MAKRDIKTIQAAYDAFGRGDIDGVLSAFDSRIQWYEPETLPWGGRNTGGKAVAQNVFGPVVAAIQNLKVKPDEFLADGDTIVALGHFTGKDTNGKNFKAPFAHVFKMCDGKVARFQDYTDSAKINDAIGGGPARRRGYPRGP